MRGRELTGGIRKRRAFTCDKPCLSPLTRGVWKRRAAGFRGTDPHGPQGQWTGGHLTLAFGSVSPGPWPHCAFKCEMCPGWSTGSSRPSPALERAGTGQRLLLRSPAVRDAPQELSSQAPKMAGHKVRDPSHGSVSGHTRGKPPPGQTSGHSRSGH